MVRNAEALNLLGMAKAVTDIAERARDKKLLPDEVQGGTFTITNPGGYGTFHGTPVISQPQAAILGTYAVVKRPWVVQDELGEDVIAIRPIMNLTLTYDHRLVDGALAGRFLRDLREKLETWDERLTNPKALLSRLVVTGSELNVRGESPHTTMVVLGDASPSDEGTGRLDAVAPQQVATWNVRG